MFESVGLTQELLQKILDVPCLMTNWDIYHLFRYAKEIPENGSYLEVGSCYGGSLVCVKEAVDLVGTKGVTYYSVECTPQMKIDAFYILITSVGQALKRVDNESIDLMFNDADQGEKLLTEHIEALLPKLKPTGILLGHDYLQEGTPRGFRATKKAVDKMFGDRVRVLKNSTIWMIRKKDI